jgi:hypothetical protein
MVKGIIINKDKDAGPPGRAAFVFIYLEGILLEGRRLAK